MQARTKRNKNEGPDPGEGSVLDNIIHTPYTVVVSLAFSHLHLKAEAEFLL